MDAGPDLATIVSDLRATLPDLLVAVDFDGTLAPLVPDPEQSRPAVGAVDALTTLVELGARVAVITGRDARTVLRLGGLEQVPGIAVAGVYGAETWHAGALNTPDTPDVMATLRERLPALLKNQHADPDVWIEDKRLSLVVHGRLAGDPEAALDPLRVPVDDLAAELDLEVHAGSGVIELRLPGYDKAGALRALVQAHTRGVLYLGDDLGDLPAFEQARQLRAQGLSAYSVGVLASGVAEIAEAADATVETSTDAVALLRQLAQPSASS
ncbi:MAG: trehalose-phosphatase [Actinomycetota bacterium]|nr:trehalose-phosphatase [Actinomycetota bacterium]